MTTVNADDYGFSSTDATDALQDAIDDPNADRIIVRNTGTPWLISRPIELRSNKEIIFEEGAVVQAKPGDFSDNERALFVGRDIQNIQLIGEGSGEDKATLARDGENNPTQFGHIVSLLGVSDFEVSGLRLTGAGGDGLHIAAGSFHRPDPDYLPYSENGLVENIESDSNRRSGLSIDSARNLLVRNSSFTNSGGTEPSTGINLEPTWNFESLEDVVIENVDVSGNAGNGFQIELGNLDDSSRPVSIDVDGIDLSDSRNGAIFVNNQFVVEGRDNGEEYKGGINKASPEEQVNGTINIRNVDISNADLISSGNGGNNPETYIFVQGISGDQGDSDNVRVNFDNVNISDPQDTTVSTTPIFIQGLSGTNNIQQVGNLSFNDISIEGNYDRDVVRADLGRDDAYLNNISGDIAVNNANSRGARSFFANEDQARNFSLDVFEGNVSSFNASSAPVLAESSEPVAELTASTTSETETIDETENSGSNIVEADEPTTLTSSSSVEEGDNLPVDEQTDSNLVAIENAGFADGLTGWNYTAEDNLALAERSSNNDWVSIGAATDYAGIGQDVTAQITSGEDYQLSAITLLTEDASDGYIGVKFLDNSGEVVEFQTSEVSRGSTENSQVDFTAPEDFSQAEIFAYKNPGEGTLFVDDFSLVQ